jgi:hypothetical protein
MAKRNCPYCAHSNATDAKFCVACGAAMHLAPCPHCGSINHINVEKCYRCGGDLPKQEILEGEPEAAPLSDAGMASPDGVSNPKELSPVVETTHAVAAGTAPTVLVREADAQSGRPSLAVMFIIICSFVFAGLYAARHRGEGKDDAAKPAGTTPVQTQAAPPVSVAPPVTVPPKAEEAVTVPPEAPKAKPEPSKPQPNAKPAAKPVQPDAPKPATPVTPCTEAVAALGLCKLETK